MKFGDEFVLEFGDKFGESPNLGTNMSPNLGTNLGNPQIWGQICPQICPQKAREHIWSQLWEELCEREESSKKGELLKKEGRSNSKWEKPSETIGKGGGWCSKLNNQLLEERKKYWEDGERHFYPIL